MLNVTAIDSIGQQRELSSNDWVLILNSNVCVVNGKSMLNENSSDSFIPFVAVSHPNRVVRHDNHQPMHQSIRKLERASNRATQKIYFCLLSKGVFYSTVNIKRTF